MKQLVKNVATKSDIADLKAELMWWMFWLVIGTIVAISWTLVVIFLIAKSLSD